MIGFITNHIQLGSPHYLPSHVEPIVDILHRISEGYYPMRDGREIREHLNLNEFLRRLFSDRDQAERAKLHIEEVLRSGSQENIKRMCNHFNDEYINRIRNGIVKVDMDGRVRLETPQPVGMNFNSSFGDSKDKTFSFSLVFKRKA